MFGSKDIILTRLQSEVEYLREQNKQLMDRLLLLADKPAYREQKINEHQERAQVIELEKLKGMSPVEAEQMRQKKQEQEKVTSIMLSTMMGGSQ